MMTPNERTLLLRLAAATTVMLEMRGSFDIAAEIQQLAHLVAGEAQLAFRQNGPHPLPAFQVVAAMAVPSPLGTFFGMDLAVSKCEPVWSEKTYANGRHMCERCGILEGDECGEKL